MPDRGHAISAMRLSRLERDRGNLTKDEFDRINRKAGKILEKKTKKKSLRRRRRRQVVAAVVICQRSPPQLSSAPVCLPL